MVRNKRARGQPLFMAHVVPGLEKLAGSELLNRLEGVRDLRDQSGFDERTSLLIFRYAGDPAKLLTLGTIEDVFTLAVQADSVPSNWRGVQTIRSCVAGEEGLERAVSIALQVRPRRRGKLSFRVIARKAGQHAFRRVDVQRAVERGLLDRFPAWRLVEDDAQVEMWVHLVDALLLVGVRLSDNTLRQRRYRHVSLPASLKPTVARAMVLLSEPSDGDVFLDPMCGSGTILIERALAGRYRLLLGGDSDPAALQAATQNVGPRYKPIEIRLWDARRLPLDDKSVSTIVTNMPFGKQIGTVEENRTLYPALLDEWTRVLRNGGRMVLLTSERRLLRHALSRHEDLVLDRQIPLIVRGLPAAIHVVRSVNQDGE